MSRSERKTKIHGIASLKSEKKDKQDANRTYRRIVKQKVKSAETELPQIKEVSNVWGFNKDGKTYNPEMTRREMRK